MVVRLRCYLSTASLVRDLQPGSKSSGMQRDAAGGIACL